MKDVRKLTVVAILVALGVVLALFKIPYPFIPWLSFDLSELVMLFSSEMVGIGGTIIVAFAKTIAHVIQGSSTPFYIGEITALVAALTFGLAFYATKKYSVVIRLVITVLIFTLVMYVFNFFIATPIFITQTANFMNVIDIGFAVEFEVVDFSIKADSIGSYAWLIFVLYTPFNLMKGFIIAFVYFAIHRPILNVFKRMFDFKR